MRTCVRMPTPRSSAALPETAATAGSNCSMSRWSPVGRRRSHDHVLRLADIGGRLSDLGKIEQATNLFREAEAIAVKLPTTGTSAWARGRLAEELAQIDLPGALNLLEGTEEERDHDAVPWPYRP